MSQYLRKDKGALISLSLPVWNNSKITLALCVQAMKKTTLYHKKSYTILKNKFNTTNINTLNFALQLQTPVGLPV